MTDVCNHLLRPPIVSEPKPKLASEEDVSEESILALPQPSYFEDPIFDPLKNARSFQIQQILSSFDIDDDDDDEFTWVRYEVKNSKENLHYIIKKKFGRLSNPASCHDQHRDCQFIMETPDGKQMLEMEAKCAYSGFSSMTLFRGAQTLGRIDQDFDMCSTCNPQYDVINKDGDKILRIPVLDNGCLCGLFGVKKYLIVSSNRDTSLGHISSEFKKKNRKLVPDERRPLEEFKVVFSQELDVEAKVLLIATTFAINFHDSICRFVRRGSERSRGQDDFTEI